VDKKCILMWLSVAAASVAAAFSEVPRASADALGVTKNSKPINSGVVFVNGKFVPPPYTVSRWGTGLRVNDLKVSGQIIAWDEFIKTQSGVKMAKPAPAAPEPAPVELAPEPGSDDDVGSSLDDLFDDDSSTKKAKSRGKTAQRKAAKQKPSSASFSLSGDFVANESSKALLKKINTVRSEIDRTLRMGGVVLFGDGYSRIAGDARTAEHLMEKVPALLQTCESAKTFARAVHDENLVFLNEAACNDLYRCRFDYLRLREQYDEMKRNKDFNSVLNGQF